MKHSKTLRNSVRTASSCCGAAVLVCAGLAGVCQAGTLPAAVSTPVGAALQSVGNVVSAAGKGHAGIAPTVYGAAPTIEPLTDGVTNALTSVGAGLQSSGQNAQSGGLVLTPATGVRKLVQAVQDGSLVQARVGSLAIGKGATTPIAGVGLLSSGAPHGSLATAGVANANALLNANVAPQ